MQYPTKIDRKIAEALVGVDGSIDDIIDLVNSRLSEAQRQAIDALESPESDYADMEEVTAAIKAIIDALQAQPEEE